MNVDDIRTAFEKHTVFEGPGLGSATTDHGWKRGEFASKIL